MKIRSLVPAGEIESLLDSIGRRLDGVRIATQPEVAAKILKLSADPGAGLRQYSEAVKVDPALSGRLLRVANSAFFAQRSAVTSVERACVLLGLERLKAVSLGFYLSRAAVGDVNRALARRVWGESVFRACIAAELAREMCPPYVAEAFVIGLMLDAGIPILHKLLGAPVEEILALKESPSRQFKAEFSTLPFTHVDIVSVLVRRWRLPEMLARPIEWHHTPPGEPAKSEEGMLRNIAYYVGAVGLAQAAAPAEPTPLPSLAGKVLAMPADQLAARVRRAAGEYAAMQELFRDVAGAIADPDALADRVGAELVEVMDNTVIASLRQETLASPERFVIGGHHVEIEAEHGGRYIAYLNDSDGQRLMSFTFEPREHPATAVLEALGIEEVSPADLAPIETFLNARAA